MLKDTIHIKGLRQLGEFMQTLAPKLERNVLRGALRAGATVIRDAAKENVPVGAPSSRNKKQYGGYEGALRDSIRSGAMVQLKKGRVMAYVRAGGKSRKAKADTYYAHIVEYGAVAHRIGSKKYNNRLYIDGKWVQGPVNHPGTKGTVKPYLRPALDAEAQRALLVIGNYIKHRLATKHGLDTKDIQVGDDE